MKNMKKSMEHDYESRYYSYKGPVWRFGKVVSPSFSAITKAKSEKQAINNLKSRVKKALGLAYNTQLELDPKCLKVYNPKD